KDAQVNYTFQSGALEGLSLYLQFSNIGDEPFVTHNDGDPANRPVSYFEYGRTTLLGLSYKFSAPQAGTKAPSTRVGRALCPLDVTGLKHPRPAPPDSDAYRARVGAAPGTASGRRPGQPRPSTVGARQKGVASGASKRVPLVRRW